MSDFLIGGLEEVDQPLAIMKYRPLTTIFSSVGIYKKTHLQKFNICITCNTELTQGYWQSL
jgi:hypothetical protein